MDGLADALTSESRRVFTVVDQEVQDATNGLKADLREQTEMALGGKVANAWRGKFYPNPDDPKGPAGFVWSKAPRIIDFFSATQTVTPLGNALAIPTDAVPRGPRGRRLSPVEVEARFNAELQPVRLKTGRIGLFIDVAGRSSRRGAGRRGRRGATKKVLMFVLVRFVRSRQLFDLQETGDRWGTEAAANIERKLADGE